MFQYVMRRLLLAVPMLLGAMSIVFFAMRVLPGDPCVAMMGDQATTEALADCTRNLGLHRPLALFPLIGGGDLDAVLTMLRSGEAFSYPGDFFAAVGDVLHHLALPALALGFTLAATVSRLSRSAMLEVISQDFIRTARAKGQAERAVVYKHALRNMLVPLLTIIGIFVAIALTGTVLTETVFTRPGLGKMLVDAISARDYPLAQGAITVFTMTIILVNLIVDMLYAVVDPRITYR